MSHFLYNKILILIVLFQTIFVCGQDLNFNDGWKFINKNVEGAEAVSFKDGKWKEVSLPHDWNIKPFLNRKLKEGVKSNKTVSLAWYRKTFKLKPEQTGKKVRVEFEGAMEQAEVWVNGSYVGANLNGYLGFEFDITPYVTFDEQDNVIAVKVIAPKSKKNHYQGAGLYRSVWLRVDDATYIDTWGTYFKTTSLSDDMAIVENETTIVNHKKVDVKLILTHRYITNNGVLVAEHQEKLELKPNSKHKSETFVKINYPLKWTITKPNIYNVVTTITENGERIDSFLTRIGLRTISYDQNYFYLNGEPIKFKGVSLADNYGLLGIAAYRASYERNLKLIKKMGANAVKVNGHPPSREFLEVCDELGLLVINEAFDTWSKKEGLTFEDSYAKDLKQFIVRDRNHPSVVMWNIGSEVSEQYKKDGFKLAKQLKAIVLEGDNTRPLAMSFSKNTKAFYFNLAQQATFSGLSYSPKQYEELKETYPQVKFYASKTSGVKTERGFYPNMQSLPDDSYFDTSNSYPPDVEFDYQEKNKELLGGFVWSGVDALDGNINRKKYATHFGQTDICGYPKDNYFLYKSQWSKNPMLYLSPHWNWKGKKGDVIPVTCFTNCEEVELFLNGKSLGKKNVDKDLTKIEVHNSIRKNKVFNSRYRLSWNVPYQKGRLKAVGYQSGIATVEEYQDTTGKPFRVHLSAEDRQKKKKDDLIYVEVKIIDKLGKLCPLANHLVNFSVKGNAKIIAIDNGLNMANNIYNTTKKKINKGMCLLILKPTGKNKKQEKIELIAKSSGLGSGKIILTVK